MMKKNIFLVIAALLLGILFGAAVVEFKNAGGIQTLHSDDDGHGHAPGEDKKTKPDDRDGHDGHDDEERLVSPTPDQLKLIDLKISAAAEGKIPDEIRLPGEFKLNADATAKLMPRLPGFVTSISVKEGDKVAKGDLLARMTSHKLGEYYSDYNSSGELEKLAESEFKMAEKLRNTKAISEREYLRYKREYADASIARRRAKAMLDSLLIDPDHAGHPHPETGKKAICTDYEIRAPFAGRIIQKDVTPGENFAEDNVKVLFVVSDLNRIWLELRGSDRDLKRLKPDMELEALPANDPHPRKGKIIFVSPVIDETTRTGIVRAEIANPDGALRPGEFSVGTVKIPVLRESVAVPRDAVQLIDGKKGVFVPEKRGFAFREVVTGRSHGNRQEILSGLKPGEKYVSSGAFELKSIQLTGGMDSHAGHGH